MYDIASLRFFFQYYSTLQLSSEVEINDMFRKAMVRRTDSEIFRIVFFLNGFLSELIFFGRFNKKWV